MFKVNYLMNKVPNLKNLLLLSKYLTNRIDYLQGAGGNISEKIDDRVMVIKSSGVEIKEIKLARLIFVANSAFSSDFPFKA